MGIYGVSETAKFMLGRIDPHFSERLVLSGTSATLSATEQACALLGAAPVEGRFSRVADIPDSCSTIYPPTSMFNFGNRSSADGPHQIDAQIGTARVANKTNGTP